MVILLIISASSKLTSDCSASLVRHRIYALSQISRNDFCFQFSCLLELSVTTTSVIKPTAREATVVLRPHPMSCAFNFTHVQPVYLIYMRQIIINIQSILLVNKSYPFQVTSSYIYVYQTKFHSGTVGVVSKRL